MSITQSIKEAAGARSAVSRCIWILETLRSRPLRSHSAAELMRALNVSRRTISRDLAALRDAGARIEPDFGAAGVRYVCFDTELASVLHQSGKGAA